MHTHYRILKNQQHREIFRPVYTRFILISFFLFLVNSGQAVSQDSSLPAERLYPSDPMELYLRMVYPERGESYRHTSGLRPVEFLPGEVSLDSTEIHPWQTHPFFKEKRVYTVQNGLSVFGISPQLFTSYNSEIPMGQNDGALWQGRGTNMSFTAGAGLRYKRFSARIKPVFVYSENREYDITDFKRFGNISEFGMHLTHADIPMRFGDSSVFAVDPGDSFLEYAHESWRIGISNERYWTGPAVYNPLLFSNNAPGFLHVYAGTKAPFETGIGSFRGRIFWGSLKESDYFDEDSSNDRRFLSGFSLSYVPEVLPGLEVGFNKTAYTPYSNIGIDEILLSFKLPQDKSQRPAEDSYVTMMSLFANWNLSSVNSEIYLEWGRNDFKRKIRDVLAEPELNRGYVLGALKRFSLGSKKRLLFNIETTNLENINVSSYYRDFNIWYTSESIPQGFTQKGQVIGAGIGPGSSTQKMSLSYFDSWGMIGASISRISHHTDRHFQNEDYFRSFARYPRFYFLLSRHEIETRPEVQLLFFMPYGAELQLNYARGNIHNRFNIRDNDLANHYLSFTLRYNIEGFVR